MEDTLTKKNSFETYWDTIAQAPYAIDVQRKLLATYDDKFHVGLLETIDKNK
jgi:GH18 family chitinase